MINDSFPIFLGSFFSWFKGFVYLVLFHMSSSFVSSLSRRSVNASLLKTFSTAFAGFRNFYSKPTFFYKRTLLIL